METGANAIYIIIMKTGANAIHIITMETPANAIIITSATHGNFHGTRS